MNVSDLIEELQNFPELASVFLQTSDGEIVHIDSVHPMWAKHGEGGLGPITATCDDDGIPFEADSYGPLLYG